MEQSTRIAIVGFGGVFPGAKNLQEFWENIVDGRDCSSEVPDHRWVLPPDLAIAKDSISTDRVAATRGCFVSDWHCDPTGLDIDARLLSELDPLFHLTLRAGREAFASCAARIADKARVSIVFGNIVLPTEYSSKLARDYIGGAIETRILGKSKRKQTVNSLNHFAPALPGGVLAKALGIGGGSYTIDAACASSLYALKLAVDELNSGKSDAVLAGGVSRPDHLYTQMGFTQLTALSKSGRSRPFDKNGDGLVVGEGAGFFVLKRLDDALKCNDQIHGVITGIGLSNDVDGGLMAPSSEGQLRSMRAAYRNAGIAPGDIDLIECHATGTPIGDAVEFNSLQTLWGDDQPQKKCVLGSVKGNVGHLLTAAGASGLCRILLAMKHETIPPTANFQKPQERINLADSPFEVLTQSKPWLKRSLACPRRAAISGFGFGGINAHVIIEQWDLSSAAAAVNLKKSSSGMAEKRQVAIVAVECSVAQFKNLESIFNFSCVDRHDLTPSLPQWKGIGNSAGLGGELPLTQVSAMAEISIPFGRFRIPPIELEQMLPQQLLMLLVADNALKAAAVKKEKNIKAGVFIGLGLDSEANAFSCRWEIDAYIAGWARQLGLDLDDEQLAAWSTALKDSVHSPLNANRTMGALGGLVASRISREFQFGGPGFTVANEANSGIRALQLGMRQIESGELDVALIGAVDFAAQFQTAMASSPKAGHGKKLNLNRIYSDGAAAFVLKELSAAKRDGNRIYGVIDEVIFSGKKFSEPAVAPKANEIDFSRRNLLKSSDIGAADALVNLALSVECMRKSVIPQAYGDHLQSWLRNMGEGSRSLNFAAYSADYNFSQVKISEDAAIGLRSPLKVQPFGFFTLRADSESEIIGKIDDLTLFIAGFAEEKINRIAKAWWLSSKHQQGKFSLALVATDISKLRSQLQAVTDLINSDLDSFSDASAKQLRAKSVFLNVKSNFPRDSFAFLYPGVGQQYLGMGRRICLAFPEILEKQDSENMLLRDQFFTDEFWHDSDGSLSGYSNGPAFGAQVAFGALVTEVLANTGITPNAVLGYSLGESTGLVATGVWRARDEIYSRLLMSPLFREFLGGEASAVCRYWGLPRGTKIDWSSYTVRSTADEIAQVIKGFDRVYLMNINTYKECVIGGDRLQVEAVIAQLGAESVQIPGLVAMHCAVVAEVEREYAEFHKMNPVFVPGVRYYSCATGECYLPEKGAIAKSLLKHGIDGVNYPKVIEQAYADGMRIFIDIGPGKSLSRLVSEILVGKDHLALSICPPGDQEVSGFLRGLAILYSHGIDLDLALIFDKDEPQTTIRQARSDDRQITIPVSQYSLAIVEVPARQGAQIAPVAGKTVESTASRAQNSNTLARINVETSAVGGVALAQNIEYSEIIAAMASTLEANANAHKSFVEAAGRNIATAGIWLGLQQELIGDDGGDLSAVFGTELGTNVENNFRDHIEKAANNLAMAIYTGYNDEVRPAPFSNEIPWLDFQQCKEFAAGKIAGVLGPDFAEIDHYATRVRLPDGPLLLCHRIMSVEGKAKSMSSGKLVTEHDIFANAWYLDGGRIPTCIAVEAGQADLFLSSYLGIDFQSKGKAVYRLLDAVVTFYRELPKPGQTIRYEIEITEFFSQGETTLFKFSFEASVAGEPLLSMRSGCAGFFSEEELASGRGIVISSLDKRLIPGQLTGGFEYPIPLADDHYSDDQLDCLRVGDFAGCFGSMFSGLAIANPGRLPGGMMSLVHRITGIKNDTGRYGLGTIYGEADIHPDDWFLECHFVDDKVMPGTLMYECCLHTLRVYLMRMGWVGEAQDMVCEPIPGEPSKLKCRGQVLNSTKKVTYEIVIKELGYRPEAYAIVDAFMYADGKMIVEISHMTARMQGLTKDKISALWSSQSLIAPKPLEEMRKPAIFDYERIRAYCEGKPSLAFGKPYEIFDGDLRKIARLPREPFCFMSRITETQAKPWVIEAGGMIEAEYDIPEDAWYFAPESQGKMPFSVLLEAALQPCGWYSGYMGSALASDQDLCYRNLGGSAIQHARVTPWTGTLRTRVDCTKVSQSGGMLIQEFDFAVTAGNMLIYSGHTMFGFFSKEALAQQVGVRSAEPLALQDLTRKLPGAAFPEHISLPVAPILMVDEVQILDLSGGRNGLGYIRGRKVVNPKEWFYQAHFYQDPVMPGSLGIEAFVQLFKVLALEIFAAKDSVEFAVPMTGSPHEWVYRGQVIPTNKEVLVELEVSKIDAANRIVVASGFVIVDDLVIYELKNFTLRLL